VAELGEGIVRPLAFYGKNLVIYSRLAKAWPRSRIDLPEEQCQRGSPAMLRIEQIKRMSPRCSGFLAHLPQLFLLHRLVRGLIRRTRLSKVRRRLR
jgi:hypothetical protein